MKKKKLFFQEYLLITGKSNGRILRETCRFTIHAVFFSASKP